MARYVEKAENYLQLALCDVGKEKCIALKGINFEPRDYYLFHYVASGKGILELNNHRYELSKGQIFMIPKDTKAKYYPLASDPWFYLWVGIKGSEVEEYLSLCHLNINNPIINDNKELTLKNLFEAINNRYLDVGYFDLFSLGYTYQLICEMIMMSEETSKVSSIVAHTNEAIEFIKNNYQSSISVLDIASNVGVNANYLANIFKMVKNMSPKECLIQIRMEKAKLLLETKKYKIKDVARMVGYPNQLHFSSQFKKYYGISPSFYGVNE